MQDQTIARIDAIEIIRKAIRVIRFLFSRWLFIGIVSVIFGFLGIMFAWLKPPSYKAEMTFVTDAESGSKLGGYASIAAQFGIELGQSSSSLFEGDNLIELFKSRNLIEKTLLSEYQSGDNQFVIETYLTNNKMNIKWSEDKVLKTVNFHEPIYNRATDSIVKAVYDRIVKRQLNVWKPNKKLNIVSIEFEDGNEVFAKRFVEILAKNSIQYYTNYKISRSKQNVDILQKQADSVHALLFGNVNEMASINDLNVNPLWQSAKTGTQRKQIEIQVNAALYTELVKNLEISKLSLRKETPLIQIIDTPKLPLKKNKPGRLLTGIIFSFIGLFFAICYLLFTSWFKKVKKDIL